MTREEALDQQKGLGDERREVSFENVSMKGMHPDGRAGRDSRQAPESACLGGMSVHDHGLLPAQDANQLPQAQEILPARDAASQGWNADSLDLVSRREVFHSRFPRRNLAPYQHRVIPSGAKRFR